MGLTAASYIAIAASVVGTAVSVNQGQKAQEADEKAQRLQSRQNDVKTARERRKQIRQRKQETANVLVNAQASGTGASSVASGLTGNITGEAASNTAFLDNTSNLTRAIGKENIASSRYKQKAQRAQTAGSLVSSSALLFEED